MPIELDLENDFSTILDGGEPLTLRRRGTTTTTAVPVAWRYTSLTQAAEPGIAGVTRGDVAWQFEWDPALAPPHVGDQLIDAANDFWTILSVEVRGNSSRLRCHARNLRITFALDDRVAIQAALWDTSGPTPVITGWTTLRSAIPARIQPQRTTLDHTTPATPTSIITYQILLDDDLPLNHNHRLIGPDGTIYQVQEYSQAERFDTLPVAIVTEATE